MTVRFENSRRNVIQITARTKDFHAIKFVEAIRLATGVGLKEGLDHVRRLSEGELIRITPVGTVSEQNLASWLQDCGVIFERVNL